MKRSVKVGVLVLAIVIAFGIFLARPKYRVAQTSAAVPYQGSGGLGNEKLATLGYISSADYEEAKVPAKNAQDAVRKIIQSGYVSLSVKHYDRFYQALQKQLAQEGGFISNLEANRNSGKLVSARIVIRIPSARTNIMVSWLHEKGEIITEKITAEDVSEEYYDTQARLANAKRLEARLIDMVKSHTGKLEDLILLEEKIGQVREQIEQMEGRMRNLDRLISLATLTIDVQVQSVATPYQLPTFSSRLGNTWRNSTEALADFLKDATLVIVGALPWLPVVFLLLGSMLLIYRVAARIFRKRSVESSV